MFVPLTFVIIIAVLTAGVYNRSIYFIGVRLKNIPFIGEEVPHRTQKVTADMMMKCPVRTLKPVATLEQIKQAMQMPIVHGFPIIDENKQLIGLISRESLMVLVGNKAWIERDVNSRFEETINKYCKSIVDIERKFSMNKEGDQNHKTTGYLAGKNITGSVLGKIEEVEEQEDEE